MAENTSIRLGELKAAVSADREELVAGILTDADLSTLKHLAKKGLPANSLRALTSDLTYLEAWSRTATGEVLPWPATEALALNFVAPHSRSALEPGSGSHRLRDSSLLALSDREPERATSKEAEPAPKGT